MQVLMLSLPPGVHPCILPLLQHLVNTVLPLSVDGPLPMHKASTFLIPSLLFSYLST
jgi:hypothetical protein